MASSCWSRRRAWHSCEGLSGLWWAGTKGNLVGVRDKDQSSMKWNTQGTFAPWRPCAFLLVSFQEYYSRILKKKGLEKSSEDEQRYKSTFIWAENTPAPQRRDLMAVCRVGMTLNGEHSLPPGVLGVGLVQTTCSNLNAFFLFVCLGFFSRCAESYHAWKYGKSKLPWRRKHWKWDPAQYLEMASVKIHVSGSSRTTLHSQGKHKGLRHKSPILPSSRIS